MDAAIKFFALVGAAAVICVAMVLIMLLRDTLSEFIEKKKYERIRKHRFDNPPTAKCFCKDCRYWRPEDGYCHYFEHRCTADCWFCWNAEPLTHREYAKREERNK